MFVYSHICNSTFPNPNPTSCSGCPWHHNNANPIENRVFRVGLKGKKSKKSKSVRKVKKVKG